MQLAHLFPVCVGVSLFRPEGMGANTSAMESGQSLAYELAGNPHYDLRVDPAAQLWVFNSLGYCAL